MGIKSTDSCRSWFCVWNHPEKFFGDIEPIEMVNKTIEMWMKNKPTRACAVNFEISDINKTDKQRYVHAILIQQSDVKCSSQGK